MFEVFINVFNISKALVYYGFYSSFKLGQGLVCVLNFILTNLITVFKICAQIITTILESFVIFFQDILQGLQLLLEIQRQLWEVLCSNFSIILLSANFVIDKIYYMCYQTYSVCENSVMSIYMLLITTCKFLKHLIILFGAGVWFAVTFIPLSFINLLHLFIHLIITVLVTCFNETVKFVTHLKDCIKNIYIFVTDVPVESVIGLLIALSIVYICTQFYMTLYQNARQIYLNMLNNLRRYSISRQRNIRRAQRALNRSERPLHRNERILNNRQNERFYNTRTHIQRRPQIGSYENETSPVETPKRNVSDEKYCVICQERIKCILLLPCRHVCMCMECNTRLQLYNNTCPICRKDIESTMKIFV